MEALKGKDTFSPLAVEVSIEEAVRLGAVDGGFFGRFFFPRAFKQDPPPCHKEIDDILDDPDSPLCSLMIPRGWAKTTKTRVYLARRVAYGISRTVMVVGKSQEAAIKTIEWLKRSIEHNKRYAVAFGLQKGERWSSYDIEILHTKFQDENGGPLRIRVMAFGMTGSVRGINVDDARPDLIIVDDPCDEENTGTSEQRKKIADLFFGSLLKSLAPQTECPHAKMVLLQTILNANDLVSLCDKDSHWRSLRISCFDDGGESTWPERFPTAVLKAEKQGFIDRFMLPLWMREMESKVISDEMKTFPRSLQFWDEEIDGVEGTVPDLGTTFLALDPTPPPKDPTVDTKHTRKLDEAVLKVIKLSLGNIYVVDSWAMKSPDPGALLEQIFLFARLWKSKTVIIETVLFQRVLKWALEQEMRRRREYLTVIPIEDKRAKPSRIQQEINAYATQGKLYVSKKDTKLLEQYETYPVVEHDDHLDALAIGLMHVTPWMLEASFIEGEFEEVSDDEIKALGDWRA